MPNIPNPFVDAWKFLIGAADEHVALGGWGYGLAALYLALLVGSILIAMRNWRDDPAQRSGVHLSTWFVRVMIGSMWFQGMLWKLPLPASGGLKFWTEQMGTRAAFEFHREFVTGVLLPNLHLFGPLVFLAELTFAVSMLLGFGVRLVGVLATLFVLHLWLGIYRPAEPAEWPWSYVFLAMLMFLFSVYAAGRSLGFDAWLRRNLPAVRDGTGFWGRLLKMAS